MKSFFAKTAALSLVMTLALASSVSARQAAPDPVIGDPHLVDGEYVDVAHPTLGCTFSAHKAGKCGAGCYEKWRAKNPDLDAAQRQAAGETA